MSGIFAGFSRSGGEGGAALFRRSQRQGRRQRPQDQVSSSRTTATIRPRRCRWSTSWSIPTRSSPCCCRSARRTIWRRSRSRTRSASPMSSPLSAARQMLAGAAGHPLCGRLVLLRFDRAPAVRYMKDKQGATTVCTMYLPTDFGEEIQRLRRRRSQGFRAEVWRRYDAQARREGFRRRAAEAQRCGMRPGHDSARPARRPSPSALPPRSLATTNEVPRLVGRVPHRDRKSAGRRYRRVLCRRRLAGPRGTRERSGSRGAGSRRIRKRLARNSPAPARCLAARPPD